MSAASLVFAALFALAAASADNKGSENQSETNSHPWLASIQKNHVHKCTGSIISDRVVLTAASCFAGPVTITTFTVRVGSSSVNAGGSEHQVVLKMLHTSYEHPSGIGEYDLALVKVWPPFEFSANVNKIELANRGSVVKKDAYANGEVTGWCWTFYKKQTAALRNNKLRLSEDYLCMATKMFSDKSTPLIPDKQFCVVPWYGNGCQGDAGGPVVLNGVQVGLKPLNPSSVQPRDPEVYNSVALNRDWIEQSLKSLHAQAEVYSYPWSASIQNSRVHQCTGSVISKDIILTAASCFGGQETSDWTVRVGSPTSDSKGSEHRVIAARRHRSYAQDFGSLGDVALIRVSPPIQFGINVQPIKLADQDYVPKLGSNGSVAGWGTTNELSDAKLKIVNCPRKLDGRICATPSALSGYICQGDAGSPLVVDGVQVGVMHFGSDCVWPQDSGLYNSVGHYRGWIELNSGILESMSQIKNNPWIANIVNAEGSHQCSGTIISENIVLTAAVCADKDASVRVGTSTKSGGSVHKIIGRKIHENHKIDYWDRNITNDVALISVSPRFVFNENVTEIKLASKPFAGNGSVDGWVWGINYEGDSELRDAKLTVVDNSQCAALWDYSYADSFKISKQQICTAPQFEKINQGGVGTPIVANGEVVGLSPWAPPPDWPQRPGVYNDVFYFRDWILKNAKILNEDSMKKGFFESMGQIFSDPSIYLNI